VLQLTESTPPIVNELGPAEARGVIYSIRGYSPGKHAPDRFGILPYFLKSLNAAGWDVIGARVPASEPDPGPSRGPVDGLACATLCA